MLERLDKVLAQSGSLSRKEVKALVRKGCVLVDGQQVTAADMKIDPETASILVNGEPFQYKRFVYIMLNKPEGVVSASNSGREKNRRRPCAGKFKAQRLVPGGKARQRHDRLCASDRRRCVCPPHFITEKPHPENLSCDAHRTPG